MDTITDYLEADHARCDTLFVPVRHAVRAGQWELADQALSTFCQALERHMLLEERIVFPAFEQALRQTLTPTSGMCHEHGMIRGVAQRLGNALRARDTEAFLAHADTLGMALHQHGEKEEGVLYPVLGRVLAHRANELVDAMRAFGMADGMVKVA